MAAYSEIDTPPTGLIPPGGEVHLFCGSRYTLIVELMIPLTAAIGQYETSFFLLDI